MGRGEGRPEDRAVGGEGAKPVECEWDGQHAAQLLVVALLELTEGRLESHGPERRQGKASVSPVC